MCPGAAWAGKHAASSCAFQRGLACVCQPCGGVPDGLMGASRPDTPPLTCPHLTHPALPAGWWA